jgi:hypothetical protein
MTAATVLAGVGFGVTAGALSATSPVIDHSVLAPESHATRAHLCSERVVVGAGGVIDNPTCNGDLNAAAWHTYARMASALMTLPIQSTDAQIVRAACQPGSRSDVATVQERMQIYELVAQYNGWRLSHAIGNAILSTC